MSGKFKVERITDLNKVDINTEFPESDYSTLTIDNKFVQLKYIEDDQEAEPFKVGPGIFTIQQNMAGLFLEKTEFTQDKILDDFVNTKDIEDRADCFFKNVHKYKEFGYDVAKRNILLYGDPGTGKSTSIAKICNKYISDNKTMVLIFPTEKFEAYQVKDFIKRFTYDGVDRFVLVMEDIGGVELAEVRRSSDSGLLSLLDNQEKTFKIPTLIIATTNFPEVFMGNLTNRPGRFDDKIKVSKVTGEARTALLKFFAKRDLNEQESAIVANKKAEGLTPAHLKEAVIRAAIHDKTLINSLEEVMKEIEDYNKAFNDKSGKLGFG